MVNESNDTASADPGEPVRPGENLGSVRGRKADRLKPPRAGRPCETESAANAQLVASLAGAGRGTREIARITGQTTRNVRKIIVKAKDDPELRAAHDEARARIRSKALDILDSKLAIVDKSWTKSTDLKSQAQMAKALTDMAFPRWGEIGGPGGQAPAVQINLGDPAVLVAMTEALRRLNTPMLDVTPRKGDDGD